MRVRKGLVHKDAGLFSRTLERIKRPVYKLGKIALPLAVFVLPSLVSADNGKKKPIVVAQATPTDAGTDAAPKLIDISKLPKVALKEMQRLERIGKHFISKPYVSSDGFSADVVVTTTTAKLAAVAIIYYKDRTTRLDDGTVVTTPAGTKRMAVRVNGKDVASIDLEPLAKLYKQEKGNTMKFLKLIPEVGTDKDVGAYIQIYVVPTATLNGTIDKGVPVLIRAYFQGKFRGAGDPLSITN